MPRIRRRWLHPVLMVVSQSVLLPRRKVLHFPSDTVAYHDFYTIGAAQGRLG